MPQKLDGKKIWNQQEPTYINPISHDPFIGHKNTEQQTEESQEYTFRKSEFVPPTSAPIARLCS